MKKICMFPCLAGALLGGALVAAAPVGAVPYPDALAAASVTEESIADISKRGLVVGNGELNAIVYAQGNALHLRLAKNDCWDLRVDTEEDPPLPGINPATGEVLNYHGAVGSWKKPYPTALPCAEIVLDASGQGAVTSATLDLATAAVTIKAGGETVEVRVLGTFSIL